MGLEAESNNAKKELNSLHCLIPSRFNELFYFLLLPNTGTSMGTLYLILSAVFLTGGAFVFAKSKK